MRTLTRISISALAALLLAVCASRYLPVPQIAHAQGAMFFSQNVNAVVPSVYTYSQGTHLNQNASVLASITSSALTLGAGDFVVLYCQVNSADTITMTGSSSPTSTPTALTQQNLPSHGSGGRMIYFANMAAGSTTFSCNFSPNGQYMSMAVVDYTHTGGNTFDASVSSFSATVNNTWTSPAFSTTGADLIVLCRGTGFDNGSYSAGAIGANTATLRDHGDTTGCEDTQFATAQTSITGSMTYSSADGVFGTALAVK
jgi:hypothetical protein